MRYVGAQKDSKKRLNDINLLIIVHTFSIEVTLKQKVLSAIYGRKISDSIYERMSLCLPVSGYAP